MEKNSSVKWPGLEEELKAKELYTLPKVISIPVTQVIIHWDNLFAALKKAIEKNEKK